jgi:H+/Cl- antiporter ClcA
MIGMGCIYLPIGGLSFFHTDVRKREFVSCGMACGLATGFGAPIGATLFSYEISQPNTFWEIQSTWKTFIAASISVVTFSFMNDVYAHGDLSRWVLNSGTLKFDNVTVRNPTYASLPAALIIGVICGLLGAGWVTFNTYYHMFRK